MRSVFAQKIAFLSAASLYLVGDGNMGGDSAATGRREKILEHREKLRKLREILYANIVLAAEIPAPTGGEGLLTRFLSDRFTEARLNDIGEDQAGNIAAVLPGRDHARNLLVAAHVDKVWPESEEHSVSVGVGRMSGRGIGDNSLGVAVLATLPLILERLGVVLDSNLILLGTTRSFGRGNVAGMRFFLENTDRKISSALCVEGMNLGRLSFSSLGMARGELIVEVSAEESDLDLDSAGAIAVLNPLVHELLEWNRANHPAVRILIGAVEAGSGFSVPPGSGRLRFEIRGKSASKVAKLEKEIVELVARMNEGREGVSLRVEMIAHRKPGDLGRNHPLVHAARTTLDLLGVEAKIEPSVSELAVLLTTGIPSLTLGITRGSHRHSAGETIELDPVSDGIAQIVSVLEFMDGNPEFLP